MMLKGLIQFCHVQLAFNLLFHCVRSRSHVSARGKNKARGRIWKQSQCQLHLWLLGMLAWSDSLVCGPVVGPSSTLYLFFLQIIECKICTADHNEKDNVSFNESNMDLSL